MRCVSPISIKAPDSSGALSVPCGKCGACLANRRAAWSFRLSEELKVSTSAVFATLTYDDRFTVFDIQTRMPTLVKRHFQLFMKLLRQKQYRKDGTKIRFYAVGEYGSKTHRPHYHVIIYNGNLSIGDDVQKSWTVGKSIDRGFVHVGYVTPATIHYITKYHVNAKIHKHPSDTRVKEFALMSRKPGIGANYLSNAKDWHLGNSALYVVNNGFKQAMPRYYRDKIFEGARLERLNAEAVGKSDVQYKKEADRLAKIGYSNPEWEIEYRNYVKSLKIEEKAKHQDKL